MITVEKILFLRHVPLFSSMPLSELGLLATIAEEEIYSAGEHILRQGEHGESMYLIVEGEVTVHSEEDQLAVLGSKNYFGELSIIDGEPRSASVSAHNDCLLLKINKDKFHEILTRNPDSAMAVIQALTRDLRIARNNKKK